jgi:UDP-N-acetylmuramate dehydrogenase
VSAKHAGFVVNRGGAACADVLELVRQVRERVLAQTGVELKMEVKMLGGTV